MLSYAFLWHREFQRGQEEGLKDRPVVVVLATLMRGDRTELIVAPVTHAKPDANAFAVELPLKVKRDLRLDTDTSWIVCDELNRFIWPGPDVRLLGDGQPFFGAIPDGLLIRTRETLSRAAERRAIKMTPRSA